MGFIEIYRNTFWLIWLRIGYLMWLVDQLVEKLFDLIVAIFGYGKLASFIRTYGTSNMYAVDQAVHGANVAIEGWGEECLGLWRCYYGWDLFKHTWISYFKPRKQDQPRIVLDDEEVRQLLNAMEGDKDA